MRRVRAALPARARARPATVAFPAATSSRAGLGVIFKTAGHSCHRASVSSRSSPPSCESGWPPYPTVAIDKSSKGGAEADASQSRIRIRVAASRFPPCPFTSKDVAFELDACCDRKLDQAFTVSFVASYANRGPRPRRPVGAAGGPLAEELGARGIEVVEALSCEGGFATGFPTPRSTASSSTGPWAGTTASLTRGNSMLALATRSSSARWRRPGGASRRLGLFA
jgi:hypothetical protein